MRHGQLLTWLEHGQNKVNIKVRKQWQTRVDHVPNIKHGHLWTWSEQSKKTWSENVVRPLLTMFQTWVDHVLTKTLSPVGRGSIKVSVEQTIECSTLAQTIWRRAVVGFCTKFLYIFSKRDPGEKDITHYCLGCLSKMRESIFRHRGRCTSLLLSRTKEKWQF